MPIAIALVVLTLGSLLFHVVSPWWWTPIASNWRYIDDTITITFWITGGVFTAVVLFMALLRLPLSAPAGPCGDLRTRKHETGALAGHWDGGGSCRHARARPVGLVAICECAAGSDGSRNRWSAMAMGVSAAGSRR